MKIRLRKLFLAWVPPFKGLFFSITFLLLIFLSSSISALSLIDSLKEGERGDYFVVYSNKQYTLFRIHSFLYEEIDDQEEVKSALISEEISIPEYLWKKKKKLYSWKEWLADGAPGNSSWEMKEFVFKEKKIREAYSFSKKSWIVYSENREFFTQLLALSFSPLPIETKQKRSGKNWFPAIVVEGIPHREIRSRPWKALWPEDGSDLSGSSFILYFIDESDELLPHIFPTFFEIKKGSRRQRISVVDMGKDSVSLQPFLPRPPLIILNVEYTQSNSEFSEEEKLFSRDLHFQIECPDYYRSFTLFFYEEGLHSAMNMQNMQKMPCKIAGRKQKEKKSRAQVELQVSRKDLKAFLSPHKKYRWLLTSSEFLTEYSEWKNAIDYPFQK